MSEVSSVTDPIHGPDSIGVGETEISSLTDPTYASVSEVLSVTDPTYAQFVAVHGPVSTGVGETGETEISSLTDPTYSYRPSSRGQPQAGADEGAIAVGDEPPKYEATDSEEDSATWTLNFGDGSGGGSESGASPSTQMVPHADDPLPEARVSDYDDDSSFWTWEFTDRVRPTQRSRLPPRLRRGRSRWP